MRIERVNAEGLSAGEPCPRTRCGGYLRHVPGVSGLVCSACTTEWRGR